MPCRRSKASRRPGSGRRLTYQAAINATQTPTSTAAARFPMAETMTAGSCRRWRDRPAVVPLRSAVGAPTRRNAPASQVRDRGAETPSCYFFFGAPSETVTLILVPFSTVAPDREVCALILNFLYFVDGSFFCVPS